MLTCKDTSFSQKHLVTCSVARVGKTGVRPRIFKYSLKKDFEIETNGYSYHSVCVITSKDICNSRLGNVKNVNKSASWHAPLTSWRKAAFRSKLPVAAKTAKL